MTAAAFQQLGSGFFLLLFGVLSLKVWRRFGPVRRDRAALAWALTAANFLVVGGYSALHAVLSSAAITMGRRSTLFRIVGEWAAAANLARGVVSVVFGALLLALLVSRRRNASRVVALAPGVLLATALVSTLALRLPEYDTQYDYLIDLSIVTALTSIVLMLALFAAVRNDGMDQLLWLALAVYTLKETVSVSLIGVLHAWTMTYASTYFNIFYWMAVVLTAGMAGLAARRLHLASGGRRVPAVFERLHALRRPAHG